MARPPRLPDDEQQIVILGKTGSGKSVVGGWHLSRRSFDKMPWYIFNPKRDKLLSALGAEEIGIKDKPPRKPGLYEIVPDPNDDENVEQFLQRTVKNGLDGHGSGTYFDEGYSIPKASPAFRRILTQGRSLHIPAITLSQRPVWMDRFIWSEASFFQYIHLQTIEDRKYARQFLPFDLEQRLPRYWSRYYDVGEDRVDIFRPVPKPDELLQVFRDRLRNRRQARAL